MEKITDWTKERLASEWINAGKPVAKRYGFAFKGATAQPVTKEWALEQLPHYGFGMGYYELRFGNVNGVDTLIFQEYSESDLY